MLIPVFTSADLTAIAANNALVQEQIPTNNQASYRIVNAMDAPVYVFDDAMHLIDVVLGKTFSGQDLQTKTSYLIFIFDNTRSGQAGAFTQTSMWQVYLELSDKKLHPKMGTV